MEKLAISLRKKRVSDLDANLVRHTFVSVRQHHDGQMPLGKADDRIPKSHRLACMRDQPLAGVLADPPSESVLNRSIVGGSGRDERGIEPAAFEPGDPMNEIVAGGVNAAVAED